MSSRATYPELDRPRQRIQAGIKAGFDQVRSASDDVESNPSLTGTAKELFDVLESTDELLKTIDLDKLSDVVEVEELPALVDLERLSDAIKERNPDLVFDLSNLEGVVNKRELWNSVDLLEFVKAKQRLEREVEDVLGEGALAESGSESEAVADVKEFVSSLRPEATQALIQQEALAKVAVGRDALVEQHATLEQVYESNKEQFRKSERQRTARNPTAVSLHPLGPLPDSISTRVSTVLSEVPHAKIKALPRIYGRRWRQRYDRPFPRRG